MLAMTRNASPVAGYMGRLYKYTKIQGYSREITSLPDNKKVIYMAIEFVDPQVSEKL